jgi:hypothetical protein
MQVRCPRCGAIRESGTRYCPVCNYDYVLASWSAPAPAAPPQAPQPARPIVPPAAPTWADPPPPPPLQAVAPPQPRPEAPRSADPRLDFGSVASLPKSVLILGLAVDVLIVVAVMYLLGHRL